MAPGLPASAYTHGHSFLEYRRDGHSAYIVDKSIHSARAERLCKLLQKIRSDVGLTQREVAKKLGVGQSVVSKYESGERRLDLIELEQVANALNTSLLVVVAQFVDPATTIESLK